MSDYHITKDDIGWKAIKAGGERASARAETKAEIQEIAKNFAINSGGGEVREHASRNYFARLELIPRINSQDAA